jgi:sterol desaturase/sphingolipid hydroxylase (fatty acid hydroxylase superfamily)
VIAHAVGLYLIIGDIEFFLAHRWMHSYPNVYQAIHKFHHSTYGTSAVSAIAMHPLDYMFEGTLILLLPCLLCGVDVQTGCAFGALASFNSIITHSGWDIPVLASPHCHFLHHSKQNVNFGILATDLLAGTSDDGVGVTLAQYHSSNDVDSAHRLLVGATRSQSKSKSQPMTRTFKHE